MFTTNAQGSYNQGRGYDGLNAVGAPYGSRFGTGTRLASRPQSIGGRRLFAIKSPGAGLPGKRKGLRHVVKATYITDKVQPRRAPSRLQKIRNRKQFMHWIQRWAPKLYAGAKAKADLVEANEDTLGALSGWWDTFTENLTDVAGKVLQYKTQKEILEMQLERARQGLPPLDTSQIAPTIAIKPDPATTAKITGAIGAGFGSLLPWLAVGGVGLFLLTRR